MHVTSTVHFMLPVYKAWNFPFRILVVFLATTFFIIIQLAIALIIGAILECALVRHLSLCYLLSLTN